MSLPAIQSSAMQGVCALPSQALVPVNAEITPELLYDVQKVLGHFSLELPRHLPEKASFCLSSASIAAVFAMTHPFSSRSIVSLAQVVFYPGHTPDSIMSVSKDEGANQRHDIVRMQWNLASGQRSTLAV